MTQAWAAAYSASQAAWTNPCHKTRSNEKPFCPAISRLPIALRLRKNLRLQEAEMRFTCLPDECNKWLALVGKLQQLYVLPPAVALHALGVALRQ
eukprot:8750293-Pyramimonas_sp.AAC.1